MLVPVNLIGPPLVFIACPLVSSVVDQLIIMSLCRYFNLLISDGEYQLWNYDMILSDIAVDKLILAIQK